MRSLAAVGRSTYHSPRMESILTLAAAVALGLGTLVAANQLMRAADHPGRPRRVLASLWLPLCMVIPTVGLVAPIGVSGSGSLVDSLDALLIVPLGVLVAVPPFCCFGPAGAIQIGMQTTMCRWPGRRSARCCCSWRWREVVRSSS